jgi:hypothetical protein
VLQGDPVATIPKLVKDIGAGALVTDLAVLRLGREWRTKASLLDARTSPTSNCQHGCSSEGCKKLGRRGASLCCSVTSSQPPG